jgi:hypothetical protein
MDSFRFTVTPTEDGQTFKLPLHKDGTYDFIVDWGDGSPTATITAFDDPDISHTYADQTPCEIIITGVCTILSANDNGVTNPYPWWDEYGPPYPVDEIVQFSAGTSFKCIQAHSPSFDSMPIWGSSWTDFWAWLDPSADMISSIGASSGNVGLIRASFAVCLRLTSIDPDVRFPSLTTGYNMFYECQTLASIPTLLLSDSPLLTSLYGFLDDCWAVTSLPAGLLDNCPLLTDLTNAFCFSSISSIPAGFLDHNPLISSLSFAFGGISISSIPDGLLDHCPLLDNLYSAFVYCWLLPAIPDGLLDNLTLLTDIGYAFSGTGILSLPYAPFKNNPNLLYVRGVFSYCSSLAGSLDGNMFLNNKKIISYNSAFNGSPGLTGHGWGGEYKKGTIIYNAKRQPIPPVDTDDCFTDCTSLDEYTYIPAAWGGPGTPPPASAPYRAEKGKLSGYHCFLKQYISFINSGFTPLKLPDGTLW